MIDSYTIELCKRNDEQGYESLYNKSLPYMYGTISMYILNEEDRKDLLQESYAKVFLNIQNFDENKASIKTWMKKIAINECLMKLRVKKIKWQPLGAHPDASIAHDDNASYEQLTIADIKKYLQDMPQGYKVILLLHMDGYSHKEIAQKLQITEATSRSQLTRAKAWLRKHFTSNSNIKAYGFF